MSSRQRARAAVESRGSRSSASPSLKKRPRMPVSGARGLVSFIWQWRHFQPSPWLTKCCIVVEFKA